MVIEKELCIHDDDEHKYKPVELYTNRVDESECCCIYVLVSILGQS